MNPYDRVHELVRAIQDSEAFRAMKAAKGKIEPDEQAKRMLNDFHMKQLEFERKQLMGEESTESEREGLQKLYDVLQLHEPVREYLLAEYQLGVLMQDVQKILGEALQDVAVM
ncbi:MAG: YlbF family regulator [Bacilli bacterium]